MSVPTPEGVLQVLGGASPKFHCKATSFNNLSSRHAFSHHVNSLYQKPPPRFWPSRGKRKIGNHNQVCSLSVAKGNGEVNRFKSSTCKCRRTESISGLSSKEGEERVSIPVIGRSRAEKTRHSELKQNIEHENGDLSSHVMPGTINVRKVHSESIEDEAWDILRESIVCYCNNPVGTIAANDLSCPSILNYDQIFIRDFVPSGIAFLLKGEYDIVRNFILHTLQLQVLDCPFLSFTINQQKCFSPSCLRSRIN